MVAVGALVLMSGEVNRLIASGANGIEGSLENAGGARFVCGAAVREPWFRKG